MKMIKLNLLPPRQKKEIEFINLRKSISNIIVRIFGLLFIFTFILISIFLYQSILLRSQKKLILDKQNNAEVQEFLEIENQIKEINQKIKQVDIKQSDLINWTLIMEEIANITPQGARLTSVYYTVSDNKLKIIGRAGDRDQVLSYQDLLEKSAFFQNIESPLSNLLKKQNVDFSFILEPVGK